MNEAERSKVHQKLARFIFWVRKFFGAFRLPKKSIEVLMIKRRGIGELLCTLDEGVSQDIIKGIECLIDNGAAGDSVRITKGVMDAEVYELLEDWKRWEDEEDGKKD